MTTFIAYRYPNEETYNSLRGEIKRVKKTDALLEGILLSSFDGEDLWQISLDHTNAQVDLHDFQFRFRKNKDHSHSFEEYSTIFRNYKKALLAGDLEKIILSKIKIIPRKRSPIELFEALNQTYANTFNYLISSEETGTWIGATPEVLLTQDQKIINTVALAGTKTADENWTTKEIEEQALVTNEILRVLSANNCKNISATKAETIQAGKIQHLKSDIQAELATEIDWKKILFNLHPTPAVCGLPSKEAKQFILNNEEHNRSFYTGFIGILKPGKNSFFVNLRCMEIHEDCAKLFVGGGITAPSDLEKEWQETERKSETLGRFLEG
jgi:isochorismate synthase